MGGSNLVGSCELTSLGAGSGCTTSGGAVVASPAWATAVFTCAAPYDAGAAAGCDADAVCAPSGAPLCFEQAGAGECPAGFQTLDADAYDDGQDERACSACACALDCAGSVDVWDDTGCGGSQVHVTGACVVAHNVFDSGTASVSGAAGAPTVSACTGGQSSGSVVPTGAATKICCR